MGRRKNSSKSTCALGKLFFQRHKHAGVLRSSMGLLSCLHDSDIAFVLEKFPNPNPSLKTFSDEFIPQLDSADAKASAGRGCKFSFESQKQGRIVVDRLQEGEEGSICDGVKNSSSKSSLRGEPPHIEEYQSMYEKLPPWVFSVLKSLQPVASPACSPSNLCYFERVSSFEKQFGWDRKLLSRLGSSWQCAGQTLGVSVEPQHDRDRREVVKVWSVQQNALLKKLKIVESTTSALESGWRNRSACVGTKTGEISLWDVGMQTVVSRIRPLQTPVSALFMDSANEMTMVGTKGGDDILLGLWDHRSFYEPIFHWERLPNAHIPIACLKSRGHDLCIAGAGGLSMHDLRKLNRNPIASFSVDLARELSAANVPAVATEEDSTTFWETEASLASEEDEGCWDDCGPTESAKAVSSKERGSRSFMSRCVGLIRSLTPHNPRQQSSSNGE